MEEKLLENVKFPEFDVQSFQEGKKFVPITPVRVLYPLTIQYIYCH
jgi:hypothetical protein